MQSRQQVMGDVCSREDITGLPAAREQKPCLSVKLQPGRGTGGDGGGGGGGAGGGAGPGGGPLPSIHKGYSGTDRAQG